MNASKIELWVVRKIKNDVIEGYVAPNGLLSANLNKGILFNSLEEAVNTHRKLYRMYNEMSNKDNSKMELEVLKVDTLITRITKETINK